MARRDYLAVSSNVDANLSSMFRLGSPCYPKSLFSSISLLLHVCFALLRLFRIASHCFACCALICFASSRSYWFTLVRVASRCSPLLRDASIVVCCVALRCSRCVVLLRVHVCSRGFALLRLCCLAWIRAAHVASRCYSVFPPASRYSVCVDLRSFASSALLRVDSLCFVVLPVASIGGTSSCHVIGYGDGDGDCDDDRRFSIPGTDASLVTGNKMFFSFRGCLLKCSLELIIIIPRKIAQRK